MTVLEAIKQCEAVSLAPFIVRVYHMCDDIDIDNTISFQEKESRRQSFEHAFLQYIMNLHGFDYPPSGNIVVCYPSYHSNSNTYEAALIKQETIPILLSEKDSVTPDNFVNRTYDVFFSDQEVVLSSTLSDFSLKRYGIYTCVSCLLYYLYMFGRVGGAEVKARIFQELKETCAKIDKGEMKTYSSDDVFKRLFKKFGFKRRSAEEQKQHIDEVHDQSMLYVQEMIDVIYNTATIYQDPVINENT